MNSITKTVREYVENDLRIITALFLVVSIMTVQMNHINKINNIRQIDNTVGIIKFVESIAIDTPKYVGIYDYINRIYLEPIYTNEVEETEVEKEINLLDIYKFDETGYISASELNVRREPSKESEAFTTLKWNSEIEYSVYDDNWAIINLDGQIGYISLDYISNSQSIGTCVGISGDIRKSYMSYKKIKSSKQYQISISSTTDQETAVRIKHGRYCVAVGTGFGASVGQFVDVTLENGVVLPCIIGDVKADKDTDASNTIGKDGGVVEFIVDTTMLSSDVKTTGDISYQYEDWKSPVVSITIYDKKI